MQAGRQEGHTHLGLARGASRPQTVTVVETRFGQGGRRLLDNDDSGGRLGAAAGSGRDSERSDNYNDNIMGASWHL